MINKVFNLKRFCLSFIILCFAISSNAQAKEVLKVEDAIAKAFVSSPHINILKSELEDFEGKYKQAGLWQNPEFGFEAENFAGDGSLSGTDGAEYTYSLSQTFEVGGKISSRKDAAKNAREAASMKFEALQADLLSDVIQQYVEVLTAEKRRNLALEKKNLAEEVYTTVKKRVDAAKEPELQLSKAAVERSTANISYKNMNRQVEIAESKLASFWGGSELSYTLNDGYLGEIEAPATLDTYSAKLSDSPYIKQYDFIESEKQSLLELEEAKAIPDPTIGFGMRDFEQTGEQAFLASISIPIPVLNRNQGNVISANSQVSKARNEKQKAILDLNRSLVSEYQNWSLAYEEVSALKNDIIPAAERAFKDARKAYESGRFTYIEVLDAQRTLFEAKERYFEALERYHSGKSEVLKLTNSFPYKITFND